MKYYAVTDDPNELMHYGVKGMRWGEHIFGEDKKSSGSRKRSSGYKNASNKLSKTMQYGINAVKAKWAKAHTPAALRAKAQRKAQRKEERFMRKAVQKAREGNLRYGKLSDDQVRKVTERLALEQRARILGSTEKPSFRKRMKEAMQEGMLRGTTAGGAAYIEEQLRAKGRFKAIKRYGAKMAKEEALNQIKKNQRIDKANFKMQKKNAWRDAQFEQDKAYYKDAAEQGLRFVKATAHGRRKALAERIKAKEEQAKLEAANNDDRKLRREFYKQYITTHDNTAAQKMLARALDSDTKQKFLTPGYQGQDYFRLEAARSLAEQKDYERKEQARLQKAQQKAQTKAATSRLSNFGPVTTGRKRTLRGSTYVRVRRSKKGPYSDPYSNPFSL